ncbi:MAG: hypothetical protein AB1716_12725 [Planctomycetota bacterium]
MNRQPGAEHSEGAVAAVPADPTASAFGKLLSERRADARRNTAGLSGATLRGAARAELTRLSGADKPKRAPRGRIPDAEQDRTAALLAQVPGLDSADARDLARIGTAAEFRAALGIMPANVRNPGGWLRRAVSEGWATAQAAEKRTEPPGG